MDIRKIDIVFWEYSPTSGGFADKRTDIKALPYLSLVQAKKGNYEIKIDDSPIYNTGEGGFFIAPSGVRQTITHHIPEDSEEMLARWLFLDARVNGSYTIDELYSFPIVLDTKNSEKMGECFDALENSDSFCEKMSIIYRLIGLMIEASEHEKTPERDGVSDAVKYMHRNYSQKITVRELSNIANMSESNLYAAFKKKYSDSPLDYLNRLRLSVAMESLRSTPVSIETVAASVGIPDAFYFSRLFKKHFGVSPSAFRKKGK